MIDDLIAAALAEDLGAAGDVTTNAIFFPEQRINTQMTARGSGVVAGLQAALRAFTLLDCDVSTDYLKRDGERVAAGEAIATIAGSARAILSGERTALNVVSHLSGIATATRRLVDTIAGTKAKIAATRKTTPGMRALEKYAVQCGGGETHRFGLYDGVLIKDNHIAAAGSIGAAVSAVRRSAGQRLKIEVEVDTLDQLGEVLGLSVDAILLDNMDVPVLRQAVAAADGKVLLEASGGITLDNVRQIAETGVDLISSGAITHSAPILDVGLDVV